MQDRIYNLLIQKDEITWQNIIYDLIRTEQMNPWDIDISLLANKYIETVKKLKEANFFISGKVLLASALLLRIKVDKLILEDIANFDNYLFNKGMEEEYYDTEDDYEAYEDVDIPKLAIKSPQARKRKVNINDLIGALKKVLEVEKKKTLRRIEAERFPMPVIPEKKINISELIKNMYDRIVNLFKKQEKIKFNELVSSEKKEDKISTLIPLLHLDNLSKINMQQKEPFGEIHIYKV